MAKPDLRRPLVELASEVTGGRVSAADLVTASLEAIGADKGIHAVLESAGEAAVVRAKEIDRLVADGKKVGRLAGVPFIAKDNFLTRATHTTAASNILKPFQAPYQATAIERLEAEGAIMVAKSNMDAFGHGSSTENSDFGPTKNPLDHERVPGGSSGGSAAAVAAGLASFALGTDTGSSIRLPASFCGVVGLMPSYGLVSRYGVIAMGSSFDTIGALANRTGDAALVLDVMAGRDPRDATTVERDPASYAEPAPALAGKKIGLIKEYFGAGIQPEVERAVRTAATAFEDVGAEVEEVSLPDLELALACYYILIPGEISSNLARYDGIRYGHNSKRAANLAETYLLSRSEGFGAEAKRRILIGTYVLSSGYYDAYYQQAQKVRTLLIRQIRDAFERFDVLMGPTAPTTAFKLGERDKDPLAMYATDVDTVAVNLVGSCALSLPAGRAQGLPIGLQLIGPQRGERTLLEVAAAAEQILAAKQEVAV